MKKRQLYDDDMGDFYPITHSEAVLTPSGKTVEEVLNEHKVDFERELRGGGQANIDPFKDMGAFATPADFNAALNSAFASTDGTLQGHLRYICQGQVVWADQIALDFSRGKWMQVVYGVYKPSPNGASLVYDYQKYHVAYRWATTDNPSALWQDALTDKVFATINGNRIDQGGNLVIGGGSGSGDVVIDDALDGTSHHAIQNAAVYDALYGANGVANAIRNLQQAMTAGKVVMVDGWGALPSNPTEGMVAFSEGKIKTYTNSLWGNGEEPDPSALYVKKNVNIVYRWDIENEEMYPLVGQEIDDAWVLNSSRPVQSRVLAKRFKKLEVAMFGREQGNSEETLIETDSFAKDLENMKDTIYGEEQAGTRSGGLNTELTGIKDSLYGQGGSALAPAQGSISQKISTLETESIKGIKVNGASVAKDQQGIANITVKATGSSYTAQAKSDWTGEDKRTSKLTNFEWAEDTDDAILVVDPNTKELWLGYCSDKSSEPRTYTYYQEWIDCGPIPSSDELASKGTTIQYTLGGILHTASYSTSTHKVTEIIIGEGAILKAQIKNDWTGETKSDHKLTNFEWSEDADDSILVVDATNNELWLGYSDMPETPRTYTFYQEWVQCGSIPANDTIAEKGQLIQYVSDGITYLATYNPTTHKVVPTGGTAQAIAQIDTSDKPVQSNVLKQEFDTIDGRITNLESVAGIVATNNSFYRLSDKDEDFAVFDYTKGNVGCFTPKVPEEDIAVEDVDNIYKVKPPYEYTDEITDAKKPWLYDLNGTYVLVGPADQTEVATWVQLFGELETVPHLWTDYELTKSSYSCNIPNSYNVETAAIGTTAQDKTMKNVNIDSGDTQGKDNAWVLRAILEKESCIGFYIKNTYRVLPQKTVKTSLSASIGGQSRLYFYFNLDKDGSSDFIGKDTSHKYYRVQTTEYYNPEGEPISKPEGAGDDGEKRAFSGTTPLTANGFAIFEWEIGENTVQYYSRVKNTYYDANGEVLNDVDDILALSSMGKVLVDGEKRQRYVYRKDRYDQSGTGCYEKDGELYDNYTHEKIQKSNTGNSVEYVTLSNTNVMYWPYSLSFSSSNTASKSRYENCKELALSLPRDLIIIGEDSGIATGGFSTYRDLFFTAHSLVLYKVKFFTSQADGSRMIEIDSFNDNDFKHRKGVDQVQIIGCEFDSVGYTYAPPVGKNTNEAGETDSVEKKGSYVHFHSKANRKPFEGANNTTNSVQTLVPDNYINHLYIKDCTFHGGSCVVAEEMRFVKSCRIIGNTFTEVMTTPLLFSTQNITNIDSDDQKVTIEKKDSDYLGYDPISGVVSYTAYYEQTKPYMSCPVYIAGNKFNGRWQITKNRQGYNYFGGFLIEGATVYALHNIISDLISGCCYKSSDQWYLPTYDAYCNCVQVYYANNLVKNIVRFRHPYNKIKQTTIDTSSSDSSGDAGTIGIFKCKSTGNGFVRGGKADRKVLRHYKNNTYTVEPERVLSLWKTWLNTLSSVMGENAVLNNEYNYDSQLVEFDESGNTNIENIVNGIHIFSIRFDAMNTKSAFTAQSAETDEIVISGNMFDAGKGAIVGIDNGARWCTNSFTLAHNIFKAYWLTSDQWQAPLKGDRSDNPTFATIMTQNFFNLELRKRKGNKTTLNVVSNEIICPRLEVGEQCTVHLVQNMFTKYTSNQWYSDSHGDISNVTGNHYTNEGTNGSRILSRISADGEGLFDWYDNVALARIPNKINPTDYVDLQGKFTTLNDKQVSLETSLFGSNVDGISTTRQLNPQTGDKYIATVEGVNKVFTCQEAGTPTQISVMLNKLTAVSGRSAVDVNIANLVMPFTDSGGGDYLSLTSEQAQAIYTGIGNLSETTRANYGLTLVSGTTVNVSYNRGGQYILEQFLLANGYSKYDSTSTNKKEPGHFVSTTALSSGNNTSDRYILIYPRYVGAIKASYSAKDSRTEVAELKKMLFGYNSVAISFNRDNSGTYLGKVTIDGTDPRYDNGMVVVVSGLVKALVDNLNVLRALHSNLPPLVINDDGTITEEQGS